ncbi:MAG: penicillin acylase family protein, partial [Bryobacterales bacterium]|nr:penicillin acylase family protein [Bryobacterales bacterium]
MKRISKAKEGLRVGGFAILGTPYIRSGFTSRHGWSHTNNNADLIDVYRETFDKPDDPLAYRYGAEYRKAETWTAEIGVRVNGAIQTRSVRFRKTHHGPITGVRDGKPLAVRALPISALDLMAQRVAMAKARSLAEFQQVMSQRAITGSNTLYADQKGNIYYLHGNAIPKREPDFDWSQPVDGADPRTEWQGTYSLAELPQQTNPASGYLQNCNSTPFFASGK